jgi:hypothetical protein
MRFEPDSRVLVITPSLVISARSGAEWSLRVFTLLGAA